MGDSMVRHVGKVCGGKGTRVECYPGIRLRQMLRKVEEREEGKEKVVVFHAGTNNVKQAGICTSIVGDVWDLVNAARQKFKGSEIVISGILCRRDTDWKVIGDLNETMEWVCGKLGVRFVDPNGWVGDKDLRPDGLHLNRSGTYKLGGLFRRVIRRYIQGNGED